MMRQASERVAINANTQGSAADIIKIAMIEISKLLKKENLKIDLIMQVHDELVFEVPGEFNDSSIKEIIQSWKKVRGYQCLCESTRFWC